MPEFSQRSLRLLSTADERLQRLFLEVVKTYDCTVLCGHRGKEEQEEAYRAGESKVLFPHSRHNRMPSLAVDVAPYPVIWPAPNQAIQEMVKNVGRFYLFVGYVRRAAEQMGIPIRCGADWDGDFEIKDQNWDDLPHFELVEDDPPPVAVG